MTDNPVTGTRDPITSAACIAEDCNWNAGTADMSARDEVKRLTHEHVNTTGHPVRFVDAVTLTPRD